MLRKLLVLLFVFLGVGQLFALVNMELVNSQTVDMYSVETVRVSYNSDNIVFFESDNNNLIIKEYMTRNSSRYYANIERSQGVISINNGYRPWLIRTRIEIYIPGTFTNNLIVNLRSGNIDVKSLSTENVLIEVSSGNIKIDELSSINLTIKNRNGNITVDSFSGIGLFEVNSGNINITVSDIVGDLSLSTKRGIINLTTGSSISFFLDAETGNGNIRINDSQRQVNTSVQQAIGSDPIYTIAARSGSGNINIR